MASQQHMELLVLPNDERMCLVIYYKAGSEIREADTIPYATMEEKERLLVQVRDRINKLVEGGYATTG